MKENLQRFPQTCHTPQLFGNGYRKKLCRVDLDTNSKYISICIPKHVGTTDNMASLLSYFYPIFLDSENAFKMTDHTAILRCLVENVIKDNLLRWTPEYLTNRTVQERFQAHLPHCKSFEKVTPKGRILVENLASLSLRVQVFLFACRDGLAHINSSGINKLYTTTKGSFHRHF